MSPLQEIIALPFQWKNYNENVGRLNVLRFYFCSIAKVFHHVVLFNVTKIIEIFSTIFVGGDSFREAFV